MQPVNEWMQSRVTEMSAQTQKTVDLIQQQADETVDHRRKLSRLALVCSVVAVPLVFLTPHWWVLVIISAFLELRAELVRGRLEQLFQQTVTMGTNHSLFMLHMSIVGLMCATAGVTEVAESIDTVDDLIADVLREEDQ